MAAKKQEIKQRNNEQDTNILLACLLREMESMNKYLKLLASLKCMEHGRELQ